MVRGPKSGDFGYGKQGAQENNKSTASSTIMVMLVGIGPVSFLPVSETLRLGAWVVLAQGNGGAGLGSLLIPFLIIGVLFYFMLIRPQKREQARVKQMQDNLKKNDRVVTAGGICGTVVNAQQDSAYVTIRVDESTNTKLRVVRSSISRVVTDGEEGEKGVRKEGT